MKVLLSLFVRVDCCFFTHRKTIRLRSLIGDDGLWVPPRLWAYAAEHQQDGDFSGYSDQEIGIAIGYVKDATVLLQALLQAGFMDADRKVHDWEEHNGYHASHKAKAKAAAEARWKKERTKERTGTEEENRGEESARARRSAPSITPSIAPSTTSVVAVGVSSSMRKPGSVEEVIAKGQFIGLGEPECRQWFIDCEACNWVRGDGSPFDNWPRQLCIYRDKLRSQPHPANGKPVSGADLRMVIQMKEERAKEIKERWATEGPVSTDWSNQEKKQEFFNLKKEIRQLKAKAERMVT